MKDSTFIPLKFNKIMQSKAYTVFVLGTDTKSFAIYTSPEVGQNIQMKLTESTHDRPKTHKLLHTSFDTFGIHFTQVVIWDVDDTIYYARLFAEQKMGDKRHILELDCRPSDALSIALEKNIPVFCKQEVLDKVVAIEE